MSTAFQYRTNDTYFIGKNQDVIYNKAFLFSNQRGITKSALVLPPEVAASWVSLYGSITVSQVGKEFPNGGMNEAGLVVEQTTLLETEYPSITGLPTVNELQWIQYMLDTCQSVQEVLKAAHTISIGQNTSKLHYLIADRNGNCAIVEFINGTILVHHEELKYPLITNSPYKMACQEIEAGIIAWRDQAEYEQNSMLRFLTVVNRLKSSGNFENSIPWGFEVLSAARREDTVFSLVYDQSCLQIHMATSLDSNRRSISFTDFDFTNNTRAQATDLQGLCSTGENVKFEEYTTDFNYQAVHSFFRDPLLTSYFQWKITDEMIHYLAHYPESFG